MSIADCLAVARDQGEISAAEEKALLRRYEQLLKARTGAAAAADAKTALAGELRAEAAARKRLVALAEAARARIKPALEAYRTPDGQADVLEAVIKHMEHRGFAGFSSVDGRMRAIIGRAHAQMEEALHEFRRTFVSGQRLNKARLDNVARERFEGGSRDEAAKRIADTFGEVAEALRQRFNAAGGEIGLLKTWGLPQMHKPQALLTAGFERWRDDISQWLDWDAMRDPLTGEAIAGARRDEMLDVVWRRVVTDGEIDLKPSAQARGAGALARRRAEHRFLHFKDSNAWLAYQRAYGEGDIFAAMMNHVRGMARDIAALEVLGPNPGATIEWMKQIVAAERAKRIAGDDSLYRSGTTLAAQARQGSDERLIDAMWANVRGGGGPAGWAATTLAGTRDYLTSTLLGSAWFSALATDPVHAHWARRLAGLPTKWIIADAAATFSVDPREAVRAGLMLEDALHVAGQEARFVGSLGGPEWARWLADRNLTWSGLTPWSQARKHLVGLENQAAFADMAETPWDRLNARMQRWMDGYGIGAAEWDAIRAADLYTPAPGSAALLRPAEIEAKAGRDLAERYLEMILEYVERAVPTPSARAKALVGDSAERRGVAGELYRGFWQFKNIALSSFLELVEGYHVEAGSFGRAAGARWAGMLLIGLTLGGALRMQLGAVATGKDPRDMNPLSAPDFWMQAMVTGGGLGLYGDFLLADVNRYGYSMAETLAGPSVQFGGDILALASPGNLREVLRGKEARTGRDATDMLRRYVPFASLWYARTAWNRVVVDQIDFLTDPRAHQRFRLQEGRAMRDAQQGFYWRPGDLLPGRLPDFGAIVGGSEP